MQQLITTYKENIEDTALEVSLSNEWRRRIFQLKKGEFLTISYRQPDELPEYVKNDILLHKLTYCVEIPSECPEKFDEGLVAFKFWAKEYPEIVRYTGNNPSVR